MLLKPEISAGLMGLLARTYLAYTLPKQECLKVIDFFNHPESLLFGFQGQE